MQSAGGIRYIHSAFKRSSLGREVLDCYVCASALALLDVRTCEAAPKAAEDRRRPRRCRVSQRPSNGRFMASIRVPMSEVFPAHEPSEFRQVLDCASALALCEAQMIPYAFESGAAAHAVQDAAASVNVPLWFMAPMRDFEIVEAAHEPAVVMRVFSLSP